MEKYFFILKDLRAFPSGCFEARLMYKVLLFQLREEAYEYKGTKAVLLTLGTTRHTFDSCHGQ